MCVQTNSKGFHTTVFHKPTKHSTCLNANSECPEQYKESVILNYLNRAYKITKNWEDFHYEVTHIKQVLVNNNFSNTMIDKLTQKFLNNRVAVPKSTNAIKTVLPIYYHNQMHGNYRLDERIIKEIIKENAYCKDPNQDLKVIVYYTNKKTSNLIMKNNLTSRNSTLQQTNVIYEFSCPNPHSKAEKYIGMTQATISRRLTMHAQAGSILQHFIDEHQTKPTRKQLTENTIIIARAQNRYKLALKEALLILSNAPSINRQYDNFSNILKLSTRKNHRHHNISNGNAIQQPVNVPNLPSPLPDLTPSILPPLINLPVSTMNLNSSLSKTYQSTSSPLSLLPPTSFLTKQPNHSPISLPSISNIALSSSWSSLNSPQTNSSLSIPPSPITPNIDHSVCFISSTQLSEHTHPFTIGASPISLDDSTKSIPSLTNSKDDSNLSLPHMDDILRRFGINPDNMKVVPITQYNPLKCQPSKTQHTNTSADEDDSPTISQRLHSLIRGARYKGKYI